MIDIRNCWLKEGGQRDWDKCLISYQEYVFAGVSFRDQKGLAVQITKQRYIVTIGKPTLLESTSTSLVCGRETDTSSGWMPIGGPIKGFYVVKNGTDVS